jgi:hypothetical protein
MLRHRYYVGNTAPTPTLEESMTGGLAGTGFADESPADAPMEWDADEEAWAESQERRRTVERDGVVTVDELRARAADIGLIVAKLPDEALIVLVNEPGLAGYNAERVLEVASAELVQRLEARGEMPLDAA